MEVFMTRERERRLTHAMNRIDAAYYIDEQGDGITNNAICLMYALDDGERHTQAEICREWLIPKTTLNSLVKRWEKDGLLVQEPSREDKRERTLRFTAAGHAFAQKYLHRIYMAENAALEKVITEYGDEFIEAIEQYSRELEAEFMKKDGSGL